jgi:toxin CcdB
MRFDVYELPAGGAAGYIVDVQSDFLAEMKTRMVIPLLPEERHGRLLKDLHPVFEIGGERLVLVTHELASIQKRQLKHPVTTLAQHRDEITHALDILFTGF